MYEILKNEVFGINPADDRDTWLDKVSKNAQWVVDAEEMRN